MKGGFLEPADSAGQPAEVPSHGTGDGGTPLGETKIHVNVEAERRCKQGGDQLV